MKIEVREKFFASVKGEFYALCYTFFKGHDKRLSSAFISNQRPAFFLEISLNSCLVRLDQLSMVFTRKIP